MTLFWSMSEVVVVHISLCTSLCLPATGGDADVPAIWTVTAMYRHLNLNLQDVSA
jgi:hypothetical protein